MNKAKKLMLVSLLLCVMCCSSGCVTYKSEVNFNKNGKGHVTFSVYYDKNSIENTKYLKVNSPQELEMFFKEKIDVNTGIKVISNTSLKGKNVLDFRMDFESLEDLKKKVNYVREVTTSIFDDAEDIFYIEQEYIDACGEKEGLDKALVEYLNKSGIKVDISHRNYRKLIKFINNAIYSYCADDDEFFEDMDESLDKKAELKTKCDFEGEDGIFDEIPFTYIENDDEEYIAKIDSVVMNFMETYIYNIVEVYGEELFNRKAIEEEAKLYNCNTTKDMYYKMLNEINFAKYIKESLDDKFSNQIKEYSLDDFTPLLVARLFDDDFSNLLAKAYYKNYEEIYNNRSDENKYILDELYGEKNIQYVAVFDGVILTATLDELYELQDEDGYITINSSRVSKLKEHNKGNEDGLDDTPWTNDKSSIMFLIVLKLIAVAIMIYVLRKKCRKEVNN